jgi:hypothetical protein
MRACMKNKLPVIITHTLAGPTDAAKRTEPKEGIPRGQKNSLYDKGDRVYRAESTSHLISTRPFSPSIHSSIYFSYIYTCPCICFQPLFSAVSLRHLFPVSLFLCLYVTTFTYLRTHAYVCLYYICVYVCMYLRTCVCRYVCMHTGRRISCSCRN